MKISPKQYARALADLLTGRDAKAMEKVIFDFVDFLVRNRDLDKEVAIVAELEQIFTTVSGEKKVKLKSARRLPEATKKQLKVFLAKKSGSSQIIISEEIDPSIIGGFVVRYDDKVIDGSLKHNLSHFQKQLSN